MSSPYKKPKILVVDDEERNRRLLQAMLTPLGYDVYLASDGEGALEETNDIKPDLILMDVMMPKLDGFSATQRLKQDESTRGIPVVIVTALHDIKDKVQALDLGADDFLSKPIEKIELTARVRSLLKVKAYNDHMHDYQEILEREVEEKTEDIKKVLSQLKKASLDTIFRLSRAAEFKDEQTGNHIYRVSHYAALLARAIGLSEADVETVMYAAPLHDIGKIGVPDTILIKPGKLTPIEWEMMKLHTVIGAQILEGSESLFLRAGKIIALSHHEKWDGSGYPYGLESRNIPTFGQITSVVDVFDALTSMRPYRSPISSTEAFSIIREGRGRHFDPRLVDSFLKLKEEILAIRARYEDKNAMNPLLAEKGLAKWSAETLADMRIRK